MNIRFGRRKLNQSMEKTPEERGRELGTDARTIRKEPGTGSYTALQVPPSRSSEAGTKDGDTPSEVDEATRWIDGECQTPLLVVETVPAPHCLTDPPYRTRNATLTAGLSWQASETTGCVCEVDVSSPLTPDSTLLDSPVIAATVCEQPVPVPAVTIAIPASRSTETVSPVQPEVGSDGISSWSVGTALHVQDNERDATFVVRNSEPGGTEETPPSTTTTSTPSTPCHDNVVGRGLTASEEEGDTTGIASRFVPSTNGSTDVVVNTPTRSRASAACLAGPREGSVVTPSRALPHSSTAERSISCTARLPGERNSDFDNSIERNAVHALQPPISFGSEPLLTTARVSDGPSSETTERSPGSRERSSASEFDTRDDGIESRSTVSDVSETAVVVSDGTRWRPSAESAETSPPGTPSRPFAGNSEIRRSRERTAGREATFAGIRRFGAIACSRSVFRRKVAGIGIAVLGFNGGRSKRRRDDAPRAVRRTRRMRWCDQRAELLVVGGTGGRPPGCSRGRRRSAGDHRASCADDGRRVR